MGSKLRINNSLFDLFGCVCDILWTIISLIKSHLSTYKSDMFKNRIMNVWVWSKSK